MTLTEEQIAALAPDSSSLKSGRDLASPAKWQYKAISDRALWGHCQGSGKLPYQTQIDTQNIAFKCSCPSRKFPCKHGIALLLLYTRQPDTFAKDVEPEGVTDWLNKRTEKVEKKAEQKDKPVDTEAQSKRVEARIKKVSGGVDELQFWIKDLLHTGLLTVPERATEFWQNPARRMIDAQAAGLAGMVKGLGAINYYDDSWKYNLTNQLTRIYTLTESFKNIDTLSDDYATEVKTQIGFTQPREELLAQVGIQDNWLVLSRTYTQEEQLTVERNWLCGSKSGRFALILQFFANAQIPELNMIPGTSIDAELVFYKGIKNYRALLKKQNKVEGLVPLSFENSLNVAYENFSRTISTNPFIERVPVIVNNMRIIKHERKLYLSDTNNNVIPINCTDAVELKMLAVSGGLPCKVFALINETEAQPLGLWANDKFYTLENAV